MTIDAHESKLSQTSLITKPLAIFQLRDLIIAYGNEQVLQAKLAKFQCIRNPDVESFLHQKALSFEKAHKSRTYLAVNETLTPCEPPELEIFGYFTISLKHLNLGEVVSKTKQKNLHGLFLPQQNVVVGYLIGQLAKNDTVSEATIGDQLLDAAYGILKNQAQRSVGGRFVVVECIRHEKLLQFYQRNGFSRLQVDPKDDMAQLVRLIS